MRQSRRHAEHEYLELNMSKNDQSLWDNAKLTLGDKFGHITFMLEKQEMKNNPKTNQPNVHFQTLGKEQQGRQKIQEQEPKLMKQERKI